MNTTNRHSSARAGFACAVAAAALVALAACQSAPPPPPAAAPPPAAVPVEAKPIGTVRVTASALNVRAEAATTGDVVAQVKRGEKLTLLEESNNWMKVRLSTGDIGWASSRFLEREGEKKSASRKKGSCLPDSDFAFATTPTPNLSDSAAHGLVVVDATVDPKGNVVSTRIVQNTTGDEALAFLTEREIKSAKFIAPVRNCVPKTFIFTYRRTF